MGGINVYISQEPHDEPQDQRDEPFDESMKEPLDTIGEDTGPDIIPSGPVPEGEYEDPLSESCRGLTEEEVERRGGLGMLMKMLGK